MKESFINYRNYLWFWLSFVALIAASAAYVLDNPIGGRNGGTTLGYTLGGVSTAAILYLMWYGIRKRAYYSKMTTLKGVLSSHIWIGVALTILVPLHSGFSFGMNVHTVAYVLMLLTIASGVWGVCMFREQPYALTSQRGGGSTKQLASSIFALSQDILETVQTGPRSDALLSITREIDFTFSPSLLRSVFRQRPRPLDTDRAVKLLESVPPEEQQDATAIIELVNRKRKLVAQLQDEARAQALVRGWLIVHVPMSFGLCIALGIHIFSVFYYH